jgi:uncharacterized protein
MTSGPLGGRLVAFPGDGATLRGYLLQHPGRPRPTIVMAHGLSATATGMVADRYAEVLHAAGINVLLYDHPGFGLSGGEPRQVLGRWIQLRGYRDAIDYASSLATVDSARIAVWGDSYGAAVALGVAAFDDRVAALVVQVPACGSGPGPEDPDGSAFEAHRALYREGIPPDVTVSATPRRPIVSFDQDAVPSILEPITAFRWFIDYGGRPGTGWQNSAIAVTPDLPIAYHAGIVVPRLHCPSQWLVAEDDEMPGAEPEIAFAMFNRAPRPKELVRLTGGHFGLLYHPSEVFDRSSAAQAEFLARVLGA